MDNGNKLYIIITCDIHPLGGMQLYTADKVKYLSKAGYIVQVFYSGLKMGKCKISYLNDYRDGAISILGYQPKQYTKKIQKKTINKMKKILGDKLEDVSEIMIESQADTLALWGELLAEELNGKHVCFICNEKFRGSDKCYEKYLDFFDFKHKRKELAGIHEDSLVKLFDGYKEVETEKRYVFRAAIESPVQDIRNNIVQQIKKHKWNIGYIGRIGKPYVDNIIQGVYEFAIKYKDEDIQFIIVGDIGNRRNVIENKFDTIKNVKICFTGDLVPIPREIYDKLDVVIAGSGCAICSAYENVPVIIPDAGNYKANGILGYTTFDTLYHESNCKQSTFEEILEQVLVHKIHAHMEFVFPKADKEEIYYLKHIEFIHNSQKEKKYYNWDDNRNLEYKLIVKYYLMEYFPMLIEIKRKIIKR